MSCKYHVLTVLSHKINGEKSHTFGFLCALYGEREKREKQEERGRRREEEEREKRESLERREGGERDRREVYACIACSIQVIFMALCTFVIN